MKRGLAIVTTLFLVALFTIGATGERSQAASAETNPPVSVKRDQGMFVVDNGFITAVVDPASGVLSSLKYRGVEMLAGNSGGSDGGYWSSVGRGRPARGSAGTVRINPATNGGARAEISCELHNDPQAPSASVDADYRYALGRGEHWLYVYSVLRHRPGYPSFGVGEARYCVKLNPKVFDYMTVDADRRRVMSSGYDWDHGSPLNLKEARRMTTGVHKGEPEHKYDYSALLYETPAYGWSSTEQRLGLWLINPSMEYLGGGPTKAELTGHLDVNPGGRPTLLNMWVGSHYGGTTISVATNESWTKVVGPFLLYCNSADGTGDQMHRTLWRDALARAGQEAALWPYDWLVDPDYPPAAERATYSGRLVLHDRFAPDARMSNVWVGLTAPDYAPASMGFGSRRFGTNNWWRGSMPTNFPPRSFGMSRGGFPLLVDWQRDAKFYQFWTRADGEGRFAIKNVRPGSYTLHAIADGVLGEFVRSNVVVAPCEKKLLGDLAWTPARFGPTVWQIGVPDRTAREFRHGDRYWQWGLYFQYPKDFPNDVNFVIGKSDWRRDWNYVQPPRIKSLDLPAIGEDEEQAESDRPQGLGRGQVESTTWAVSFTMTKAPRGMATLRLAFCGTHVGCNVEASVNGKAIGETGPLPSTSAMQRDGIRAYWIEKDLSFPASTLQPGTNTLKLHSRADSWSQGVMYDCVRLEISED